jgi:flagellar protein FliO/FliZ
MNLFLLLTSGMGSGEEINFGMLFVRMVLFLLLVLGLIYVLLRKVLPMVIQAPGFGNRTVKILERVPLDQKRSLLVVEVQEKVYLIGAAEGQINVLMELDREKITAQVASSQKPPTFQEVLKKTFSRQKSL